VLARALARGCTGCPNRDRLGPAGQSSIRAWRRPWLEWHQDGFDLAAGARELATGGASVQAYAIGPHLGLQFHPEATEPITQAWLRATQPPLPADRTAALRQGWQDAATRRQPKRRPCSRPGWTASSPPPSRTPRKRARRSNAQ